MAASIVFALPTYGADANISLELLQSRSTTEGYNTAALRVMLGEVNQIARDLKLPEKLPIQAGNLLEVRMSTPFWSDHARAFGSISTSNYHYSAAVDNKLSYVIRNLDHDSAQETAFMDSLKRRYSLQMYEIDTNAAYMLATQWLTAAQIDVKALERDSSIQIQVWNPGGGDKFIPLYWIRWLQPFTAVNPVSPPPTDGMDIVAMVELVETEKLLVQINVNKPEYIKRKRLVVPDRDLLLQQTDDPKMREVWLTTDAYKDAAFEVMLREVNRVCSDLKISECLPIARSTLTEIRIETPYFADHQKRFATLCTTNYVYAANAGNKLNYINKNFRIQDESKFLTAIKAKYATSRNKADTKPAYRLATQWLAAASVDVGALEHDCEVETETWDLDDGRFVPIYQIHWLRRDKEEEAAYVELLEPERLLLKLWVQKPEYIKREPLVIPDREVLLSQTNSPPKLTIPPR